MTSIAQAASSAALLLTFFASPVIAEPLPADLAPAAPPAVSIINKGAAVESQPNAAASPAAPGANASDAKAEPAASDAATDNSAAAEPESAQSEALLPGPEEAAAAAQSAPPAPAAPQPPAEPTLEIAINLTNQRMTVTENGAAKFTWPVSSGAFGYATPTGTFRPTWMARMWHSRQYDMAPMPHSIFFKGGAAIHATYSVGMLGRPASHGCVRLSPKNAATLYRMVEKHGKALTRITVHGKPNYGPARVAKRRQANPRYAYGYGGYFAPPAAYSYGYAKPQMVYPGDQRAVVKSQQRRAQQMRKQRRAVVRQYYSGYGYGYGY